MEAAKHATNGRAISTTSIVFILSKQFKQTVRLHMVVMFDPTVKCAAIASVLFDILLNALMTL